MTKWILKRKEKKKTTKNTVWFKKIEKWIREKKKLFFFVFRENKIKEEDDENEKNKNRTPHPNQVNHRCQWTELIGVFGNKICRKNEKTMRTALASTHTHIRASTPRFRTYEKCSASSLPFASNASLANELLMHRCSLHWISDKFHVFILFEAPVCVGVGTVCSSSCTSNIIKAFFFIYLFLLLLLLTSGSGEWI